MVRVLADAELIVLLRHFWVLGQEVECLSVPKVGWNALRVELAGVLEVLDGLCVLAELAKERRIVETGPEVFLVHLEARFEV